MHTLESGSKRFREYWTWIAGAMFLLITVDMLTTMYAAHIYGVEAESNPFIQWVLEQGLMELVIVKLLATVLVGIIFRGLMALLLETNGSTHWMLSRSFEVWIGGFVSAGLFVMANNLTVIFHGQTLF